VDLIVVIQSAAGAAQAPVTALRFARAALAAGHRIRQVFCQGDGVAALAATEVPADELDVAAAWRQLASAQGFAILACATAAARRGWSGGAAAGGFAAPGTLGQLMAALTGDVRVVTFAG
jgi:tRNA 2-thiouridine synthesizing protein D